jgi:hypothetical protein
VSGVRDEPHFPQRDLDGEKSLNKRHWLTTHLLEAGSDLRTVHMLVGQRDLEPPPSP